MVSFTPQLSFPRIRLTNSVGSRAGLDAMELSPISFIVQPVAWPSYRLSYPAAICWCQHLIHRRASTCETADFAVDLFVNPTPLLSRHVVKIRRRQSKRTWDGIAQSVQRLATSWTVRGSKPGRGEIFRTRPDRPGAHSAIYTMGTGSLSRGIKQPGRGVTHHPPSSADVKERVHLLYLGLHGLFQGELYLSTFTFYSPPPPNESLPCRGVGAEVERRGCPLNRTLSSRGRPKGTSQATV
jgi:hypothetical protein